MYWYFFKICEWSYDDKPTYFPFENVDMDQTFWELDPRSKPFVAVEDSCCNSLHLPEQVKGGEEWNGADRLQESVDLLQKSLPQNWGDPLQVWRLTQE